MNLVYIVIDSDIYLSRIPGLKIHKVENRGLSVTQTRLGSFPVLSEFKHTFRSWTGTPGLGSRRVNQRLSFNQTQHVFLMDSV